MTGKENRAFARRRWLAWSSVLVLVLLALFVGAPLFLGPGDDEAGGGDSGHGAPSAPLRGSHSPPPPSRLLNGAAVGAGGRGAAAQVKFGDVAESIQPGLHGVPALGAVDVEVDEAGGEVAAAEIESFTAGLWRGVAGDFMDAPGAQA